MGSDQVMRRETVNGWNEVGDQGDSEFTFPRYTAKNFPTVTSQPTRASLRLAFSKIMQKESMRLHKCIRIVSPMRPSGMLLEAEHRGLNVV